MSYDIQVYPIQLEENTKEMSFDDALEFIEKRENLINFSSEQIELIEEHLQRRGYFLVSKSKDRKDYEQSKYPSVSVMFTPSGLYFNARGEDVMEISMTAGEFTYFRNLEGKFAVMDTSNKGWQKK